jgi:hypothetical protein
MQEMTAKTNLLNNDQALDDAIAYYFKLEKFRERVREEQALIVELNNDYLAAIDDLMTQPANQLKRRTLIRTLFALVEGATFAYKQLTLEAFAIDRCELSPNEQAMLNDEYLDPNNNGKTRKRHLPFIENVKFALKMVAQKVGRFDFILDDGINQLASAAMIRNGLMHPKSVSGLTVNDPDLKLVMLAGVWFQDTAGPLLKRVAKGFDDAIKSDFPEA